MSSLHWGRAGAIFSSYCGLILGRFEAHSTDVSKLIVWPGTTAGGNHELQSIGLPYSKIEEVDLVQFVKKQLKRVRDIKVAFFTDRI